LSAEAVRVPPGRQSRPTDTGQSGGRDGGRYIAPGGLHRASQPRAGPSLDEGRNNSARCDRVRLVSTATGEVLRIPCRSWRCPRCSVSNRRAFVKRLRMGLAAPDRERPKLLTLTSRPDEAPWESRRRLTRRFAELRRRVARAFPGAEINYAGAVELTEAGRVHLHVVMRGVPFLPQPVWSRLVASCGFGFVVDVRQVRSADAMGAYLTKSLGVYLTKQAGTGSWPAHFRRIRFSQAWAPEWVSRGRRPSNEGAPRGPWQLIGLTPISAALRAWEATVAGQGPPREAGGAAAIP